MSFRAVLILFLILLARYGAFSYPTGPPISICNNSAGMFLRPGASHGDPQAGNGGFLISTDLPLSEDNAGGSRANPQSGSGDYAGGYNYIAGRLYTGRLVASLGCMVMKQVFFLYPLHV